MVVTLPHDFLAVPQRHQTPPPANEAGVDRDDVEAGGDERPVADRTTVDLGGDAHARIRVDLQASGIARVQEPADAHRDLRAWRSILRARPAVAWRRQVEEPYRKLAEMVVQTASSPPSTPGRGCASRREDPTCAALRWHPWRAAAPGRSARTSRPGRTARRCTPSTAEAGRCSRARMRSAEIVDGAPTAREGWRRPRSLRLRDRGERRRVVR